MNDNITEINKDTFWKLIQSAKETCGQDKRTCCQFCTAENGRVHNG